MSAVKKICICAVCIALCCVLTPAFHAIGAGAAFSPIHLPVLLCGLVCGWGYGAVCGVLGPVLSFLISSMPGAARLPYMIPELVVYGVMTGVFFKLIRTGHEVADLYLSMIPAMLLGRVVGGLAQAAVYLADAKSYTLAAWAGAYFVQTVPGTILQLIAIPALVLALRKARLIPARYTREGARA